jgi:hypothetical protein
MASQKHLDREHEGGFRLENQRLPHSILIDFKVSACHVFALLVRARAAILKSLPSAASPKTDPTSLGGAVD